jgi:large subunit ribosomal protein L29
MKPEELRNLTLEELTRKVNELKKQLFDLKIKHSRKALENPMQIRNIRKDIARCLTIINEKKKN